MLVVFCKVLVTYWIRGHWVEAMSSLGTQAPTNWQRRLSSAPNDCLDLVNVRFFKKRPSQKVFNS